MLTTTAMTTHALDRRLRQVCSCSPWQFGGDSVG